MLLDVALSILLSAAPANAPASEPSASLVEAERGPYLAQVSAALDAGARALLPTRCDVAPEGWACEAPLAAALSAGARERGGVGLERVTRVEAVLLQAALQAHFLTQRPATGEALRVQLQRALGQLEGGGATSLAEARVALLRAVTREVHPEVRIAFERGEHPSFADLRGQVARAIGERRREVDTAREGAGKLSTLLWSGYDAQLARAAGEVERLGAGAAAGQGGGAVSAALGGGLLVGDAGGPGALLNGRLEQQVQALQAFRASSADAGGDDPALAGEAIARSWAALSTEVAAALKAARTSLLVASALRDGEALAERLPRSESFTIALVASYSGHTAMKGWRELFGRVALQAAPLAQKLGKTAGVANPRRERLSLLGDPAHRPWVSDEAGRGHCPRPAAGAPSTDCDLLLGMLVGRMGRGTPPEPSRGGLLTLGDASHVVVADPVVVFGGPDLTRAMDAGASGAASFLLAHEVGHAIWEDLIVKAMRGVRGDPAVRRYRARLAAMGGCATDDEPCAAVAAPELFADGVGTALQVMLAASTPDPLGFKAAAPVLLIRAAAADGAGASPLWQVRQRLVSRWLFAEPRAGADLQSLWPRVEEARGGAAGGAPRGRPARPDARAPQVAASR